MRDAATAAPVRLVGAREGPTGRTGASLVALSRVERWRTGGT